MVQLYKVQHCSHCSIQKPCYCPKWVAPGLVFLPVISETMTLFLISLDCILETLWASRRRAACSEYLMTRLMGLLGVWEPVQPSFCP